ncbi:MAG TPA: STAS domain-containing protein [Terriglobia bacterium]|nr:STAS domain-containing protein [Terriglobia bacterium]
MRNLDKASIIDPAGDVDLYSSPRLREALLAEIKPNGPCVLVNMSGVSYIDSSGIATLVEGLQLSRQTKTRFGLFGLRPNARSVLELARLHKVFTIFEDEAEALEKIGSVQPFEGV